MKTKLKNRTAIRARKKFVRKHKRVMILATILTLLSGFAVYYFYVTNEQLLREYIENL